MMVLEQELETYQEKLPELICQVGRYVVIHGSKIIGTYNDYEDALQDGYKEVGLNPFLVKKIEDIETVHYI